MGRVVVLIQFEGWHTGTSVEISFWRDVVRCGTRRGTIVFRSVGWLVDGSIDLGGKVLKQDESHGYLGWRIINSKVIWDEINSLGMDDW